jgi:hypothetical protein
VGVFLLVMAVPCYGRPKLEFVKGGPPVPSLPVPSSPAPIPRSFPPFPFPYPTPPLLSPPFPFLGGLGYYSGKIADTRGRNSAHSRDQNLLSDHPDYYRERLPI